MAYSPQLSADEDELELNLEQPLPSLQAHLVSHDIAAAAATSGFRDQTPPVTSLIDEDVLSPNTYSRLFQSSPLIDKDPEKRKEHRIQKGQKARKNTMAAQREIELEKQEIELEQQKEHRRKALDSVLSHLHEEGIPFADLMEYVFNPEMGKGAVRWHEFFVYPGKASKILDWWTSNQNSKSAKKEVSEWAFNYTAKTVSREAQAVTKSKELQTMDITVNEEFVMSFSFTGLREWLETTSAPTAMKIFRAFSVPKRPRGDKRQEKTNTVSVKSHYLRSMSDYCFYHK